MRRVSQSAGWILGIIGITCLTISLLDVLPRRVVTAAPTAADARQLSAIFREISHQALPSIVAIETRGKAAAMSGLDPDDEDNPLNDLFRQNPQFREFFRERPKQKDSPRSRGMGSGFVIDEAGVILTNSHVVRGADEVKVRTHDGHDYVVSEIKMDENSDIAVLRIKDAKGLKALRFGDSDTAEIGDWVLAVGNPYDVGMTVTAGIISAKSRGLNIARREDFLQTDAAINPGNSGGPLVNLRGELIGINVAVYREAQGIGFAIPIKRVNEALSEFFTPEAMRALWFGARVKSGGGPLIIQQVQDGSPAQRAGLRTNEVILQVNGHAPKNLIEFNRELTANADRKDVTLVVQRGYDRRTVTVRLLQERDFFNAALIRQKTGITLQEMTAEIAAQYGLRTASGFVITAVEKGSPAALAELQPYFLVQGIDGLVPPNLVEAAKLLHAKKTDATVRLDLIVPWRRGNLTGYREGAIELKVR